MNTVRRATERDIPAILRLLIQVNMVHHRGRPDLFKGPTTKYTEADLKRILADAAPRCSSAAEMTAAFWATASACCSIPADS